MVTKSPEYTKAVADVEKLSKAPPDKEMLKLYGLFKIAEGEDIKATEAKEKEEGREIGRFELKKKAKRNEWRKNVEERKLSVEDAQKEYVELVEELKKTYGFNG